MREMIISELSQAVHDLARGFAHYLPRLIVMLVIASAGWLIAYVIKVVLRSILRLTKFDRLAENAGASQLLSKAALPSATEMMSRFVFWLTWLGFLLLGVSVLGIMGLQEQIARFFLFLPRLFVAGTDFVSCRPSDSKDTNPQQKKAEPGEPKTKQLRVSAARRQRGFAQQLRSAGTLRQSVRTWREQRSATQCLITYAIVRGCNHKYYDETRKVVAKPLGEVALLAQLAG